MSSWRDILGIPAQGGNCLTQNTHNTQNPPPRGNFADIADSAYGVSTPKTTSEPEVAEADLPLRRWLIRHADGSLASHSFDPPATQPEVEALYPGARVEPEPEVELHIETVAARPLVTCGTCQHWERDRVGDGSGLGSCAVSAPASREPGTLWPNSAHRCKVHLEVQP